MSVFVLIVDGRVRLVFKERALAESFADHLYANRSWDIEEHELQ